jgi:hypothetical protein
MAATLRNASDIMLENSMPHIIFCIFVAARFYIIYSRALQLETPNKVHLLIYALSVCGQRWPLARRLQKVLRTALVESSSTVTENPLPIQFYDMQYFSLDIDRALQIWAEDSNSV